MLHYMKSITVLLVLAFLYSCSIQGHDEFKGYLVYDEELVGFYPCGDKKTFGINRDDEVNLWSIYQNTKKYIREPIYIEVKALIKKEGEYGSGLVPEPIDQYLLIKEINKIENHKEIGCDAKVPRSRELDPKIWGNNGKK